MKTRDLILESHGYAPTLAWGFEAALHACKNASHGFDLFILGHSFPVRDKKTLIAAFREQCNAPVIALTRPNEPRTTGADYYSDADPTPLMKLVNSILNPDE